ncbi:putative structural protein [Rhizobium phage RHph_X2_24]|nr:putative structural protein [Rhizobium phage RHph_X2_24]
MAKYSTTNVAGFTAYHEARGRTVPGTWDNVDIEAALLVASEWIDNKYGPSFIGFKTDGFLQDREWPRTGAVTDTDPPYTFLNDAIPDRVTNAVYEAAWRQASNPGSLSVDYTPAKYKRVSVDGAVSVEYAGVNFVNDLQTQIAIIDQILSPLLDPGAGGALSAFSGAAIRV